MFLLPVWFLRREGAHQRRTALHGTINPPICSSSETQWQREQVPYRIHMIFYIAFLTSQRHVS